MRGEVEDSWGQRDLTCSGVRLKSAEETRKLRLQLEEL